MLISVYKPTRVGSNLSTCTFESDIKHNITANVHASANLKSQNYYQRAK